MSHLIAVYKHVACFYYAVNTVILHVKCGVRRKDVNAFQKVDSKVEHCNGKYHGDAYFNLVVKECFLLFSHSYILFVLFCVCNVNSLAVFVGYDKRA